MGDGSYEILTAQMVTFLFRESGILDSEWDAGRSMPWGVSSPPKGIGHASSKRAWPLRVHSPFVAMLNFSLGLTFL